MLLCSLPAADFYVQFPYRTVADVVPFVEACATRGDPTSVLAALDLWSERYPMFQIGSRKGEILDEAVRRTRPQVAVEVGSFLGYSAVRIARALPSSAKLICVEASEEFASVAEKVVEYAGLRADFQTCLGKDAHLEPMDFLFLDHAKEAYAPDLQTFEGKGWIHPGTVVLADNVKFPGAPGFLDYLEPLYDTQLYEVPYESIGWETQWKQVDDAMSLSTRRRRRLE